MSEGNYEFNYLFYNKSKFYKNFSILLFLFIILILIDFLSGRCILVCFDILKIFGLGDRFI